MLLRALALLKVLMFRRTRPVSRQQLFEQVFNLSDDVSPESIELYIHRLRKKLQASNVRITTLRGLGYLLELERHEMGKPQSLYAQLLLFLTAGPAVLRV